MPSAKNRVKATDIKEQWLANKMAEEQEATGAGASSARRTRTFHVKAFKHVFDRAFPIFYYERIEDRIKANPQLEQYSKERLDKAVAELLGSLRSIVAVCEEQLERSSGFCASVRSLFECCHGELVFHEPK